jgi:carbonic anhydrase
LGGIEVTDLNGHGPYSYKVNHMHMHGPAEHRLDGVQYDLEVHIVHELVDGPEKEHYKETLATTHIHSLRSSGHKTLAR